jgi:nanoRNase/pAp phosphatase (c-di-AMP/oligoRNAs hydrolase)
MSLTLQEQFQNFLKKSQDILIVLPPNFQGDNWGAALGLYNILNNSSKNTTILFAGEIQEKFSFLSSPKKQIKNISGARDFVLSFDTSRNKISNVRWEKENEHLNIFVTPERGTIDPRDFSFVLAKFKYDLIIVLGSPDLESLGEIYEKNTDLFFEVPVINIDNKSENDNFGKINIVDVTASSCSEIIFDLLEDNQKEKINKDTAQNLLTGLIAATERFQKRNTTPKTFFIASQLMARGADQQEIIRWLYKTQPLSLLKLWGRAMAKLNWNEKLKMAWSEISVRDFVESRANPKTLPLIMDKLRENYSEGKIFMLLFNDTPNSSVALIKTNQKEILQNLIEKMEGQIKNDLLEISLEISDLQKASKIILEKIS